MEDKHPDNSQTRWSYKASASELHQTDIPYFAVADQKGHQFLYLCLFQIQTHSVQLW